MAMPSLPSSAKIAAPVATTAAAMPDAGVAADEAAGTGAGPFASLLQQKIGQVAGLLKGEAEPVLILPETEAITPAAQNPDGLSPLFAMLSAPDAVAPILPQGQAAASEAPAARAAMLGLLADRGSQEKPGLARDATSTLQKAAPDLPLADNLPGAAAKPASAFDAALQSAANLAVKPDTEKSHAAAQPALIETAQVNAALLVPAEKTPVAHSSEAQPAITTPVGHEGWADEVGDHVMWMSKGQESHAEIILTPPHLGKIEISLNISGDQASLTFVSANPQVREALEEAMSRLREVLAAGGIQLGQTNVGAESFGSQAQDRKNGDNGNSRAAYADGMGEAIQVNLSGWTSQGNGMVDTFA